MKIKEISLNEFYEFTKNHILASHYQTMNYALLMSEEGYEHEFIGYVDNNNNKIYAVSLILIKKIKGIIKYGYAPRGFIIDYLNKPLVKKFTNALKDYYRKKNVCFIKINPELAVSEIEVANNIKKETANLEAKNILEDCGYVRLKDNLYFESLFPRFNAIVPLKDFNLVNLTKNTRNKIKRSIGKGLNFELAGRDGMDILQDFIKKKRDCNQFYYKDYYNAFHNNDMVDLFLVSIDSENYLLNSRKLYEAETEKNAIFNKELIKRNTPKNINKKMMSDKKLLAYKNDVYFATELSKKQEKIYIAGALVVKFRNRVNILISGYDKKYKSFDPNYYLHYVIMNYYKNDFDYLDLNGITGDFERSNPYRGLNRFKLGFNPKVYEFIGEYDLPIKTMTYNKLRKSGQLAKTFNKTNLKEVSK